MFSLNLSQPDNVVSVAAQPQLFLPPPPDMSDQGTLPPDDFDNFAKQQNSSSHAINNSFSSGYGLQPLYRDDEPELRRYEH